MTPKSRPTVSEYHGLDADAYGTSQWMAKNQIRTSQKALALLESDQLGGPLQEPFESCLFLDLGCGTGYSSLPLLDSGIKVIGIDISWHMLRQVSKYPHLHLVHADMRALPLRSNQIDHVLSISAFNFITTGTKSLDAVRFNIQHTFEQIARISKQSARCIIEFYPSKTEQPLFLRAAKASRFTGGLWIDHPHSKHEKIFLLLQKN